MPVTKNGKSQNFSWNTKLKGQKGSLKKKFPLNYLDLSNVVMSDPSHILQAQGDRIVSVLLLTVVITGGVENPFIIQVLHQSTWTLIGLVVLVSVAPGSTHSRDNQELPE